MRPLMTDWRLFVRSGRLLHGRGCAAGLTLWRWALCAHFAAMLVTGSRRGTRFARWCALRSNNHGEPVDEARTSAPTLSLRFSPPQRSPRRTAPAAKQGELVHKRWNARQPAKACVRCDWRASMALSSARGRVGARSALRDLTHRRCLSGSEAQRNGSEFRRCDRPLSNARQSPQATAIVKRQTRGTHDFAASKEALRFSGGGCG
jgi:hypothetical protein